MEDTARYLLIGGGPACVWAAQSIRERDAEGRILIVKDEPHPPYDRPPLSKQSLTDDDFPADDAYSKFDNFYPDNRIDLQRGVRATRIEPEARRVTLDSGDTVRYEKLLLATGAEPRRLDVPGGDRPEVHYLRTLDDSEAIRAAARDGRRAVVIGASYMGLEVASGCLQRGLETTVIEQQSHPWPRFASPALGRFLRDYYEGHGVRFLFGDVVTGFSGDGGALLVRTRGGQEIPADFAVACVGVTLNTQLARDAGLAVDESEGVVVDEFLQTSDPNIWAAGDIAFFPDTTIGRRWHAEHHLNAKWQGQAVGAILAGERKPYDRVAYFFSDFLDLHMILRGDPSAGKETTLLGDRNGAEFVELYPDDAGRLRLGVAISHEEPKLDPISDRLEELIRAQTPINEITAATFDL